MSLVIALCGTIGSGKTTVADHLVLRHGFQRVKFADGLKNMLAAFLRMQGCTDEYIKRCIEGDLKTKPIPELGGRTPRHAMVTLGTEWGRNCMNTDLWVIAWRGATQGVLANRTPVVVDDCRFLNEYDAIRSMNGLVWRVAREGGEKSNHVSETEQLLFDVDANKLNNASINQLLLWVDQQLRAYQKKVYAAAV